MVEMVRPTEDIADGIIRRNMHAKKLIIFLDYDYIINFNT